MNKIAMYKEQIYKIAEFENLIPPNEFKEEELSRVIAHAFSYFPKETEANYRETIKNKLRDSSEFRDHLDNEWMRRSRARAKHPHGGKALLGIAGASALLGGITSAPAGSLANILRNKASLNSLKALANRGVPPGITAGLILGDSKRRRLDEDFRDKTFGPKSGINTFKSAKDLAIIEIKKISGAKRGV